MSLGFKRLTSYCMEASGCFHAFKNDQSVLWGMFRAYLSPFCFTRPKSLVVNYGRLLWRRGSWWIDTVFSTVSVLLRFGKVCVMHLHIQQKQTTRKSDRVTVQITMCCLRSSSIFVSSTEQLAGWHAGRRKPRESAFPLLDCGGCIS